MQAVLGIFVLLALGWLFSMNRKAIRPRIVTAALLTQIAIGAIVLFLPMGKTALKALAEGRPLTPWKREPGLQPSEWRDVAPAKAG